MKIIVSGDRNWDDPELIARVILLLDPATDTLIEGEALGADTLARIEAEKRGITVDKTPANWKKFGGAAGPIRNREMLDKGGELVIAFHDDLFHSKGTKDMCNQAQNRSIPVHLIDHRHADEWIHDLSEFLNEKRNNEWPSSSNS